MSTHNMFLWRIRENYPLIIIKYPPYLACCILFAKLNEILSFLTDRVDPNKTGSFRSGSTVDETKNS